jgi:hypothetical protein
MVFKWHAADYRGLPDEEAARAALRATSPEEYLVPYCSDYKDMSKPEMMQKFKDGPIVKLTVRPAGPPTMGAAMRWDGPGRALFETCSTRSCTDSSARSLSAGSGRGNGLKSYIFKERLSTLSAASRTTSESVGCP